MIAFRAEPAIEQTLGSVSNECPVTLAGVLKRCACRQKATDSASDLRCELPPKIPLTIKVCSLFAELDSKSIDREDNGYSE